MQAAVTLCRIDDIPDGAARGFDPGGTGRDTLFAVRRGATVHGWYDRCPHEGETPLPYKRHAYLNKAATRIVCYAHGAQFDIASGEGLAGPCLGMALSRAPLAVDADGNVVLKNDNQ
jgi:nitrite reductase/ring-hydroxylating ferredoxin subunit